MPFKATILSLLKPERFNNFSLLLTRKEVTFFENLYIDEE